MLYSAGLFHKMKCVRGHNFQQCPTLGRWHFFQQFLSFGNLCLGREYWFGCFVWACQELLVRLSVIIQAVQTSLSDTIGLTDRRTDRRHIRHTSQSHEDRYGAKTCRGGPAKTGNCWTIAYNLIF